MNRYLIIVVAAATAFIGTSSIHSAVPAYRTPDSSTLSRAGLPTQEMAKTVLSAALRDRHPQWIDIPIGSTRIRSFVVFPERMDHAPALVITARGQGMTDWLRAVGDDAAQQGFIAVVPDLFSGAQPDAIVRYAMNMPASNGNGASVTFNFESGKPRIDTVVDSPHKQSRSFELTDHSWHTTLAFLGQINTFTVAALQVPASGTRPKSDDRPNMGSKPPDLPANFLMAAKTVAQSPRKSGWIDIPMSSGPKLHTWISYPQTTGKAPVVLVFQPGPGMDMGEPVTRGGGANWLRGIADQLAQEGFVAVLPDLTSGLGPNGGNYDSFQYPDDSASALSRLSHTELLNRVRIARDYAMKLPMAGGRLGVIGFCFGGALAWESAAQIERVNASVVFYGGPPAEDIMKKISVPVIAFFGKNDLGLEPVIEPATADMKRLGKDFEVHAYESATHAFLYRQDLGKNYAATRDAWPRAIAFFKKHLIGS